MKLFVAIVVLLKYVNASETSDASDDEEDVEPYCPTSISQIKWGYTLAYSSVHTAKSTLREDFVPTTIGAGGVWELYPMDQLCLAACAYVHRVYAGQFEYGVVNVKMSSADKGTRLFGLCCKARYGPYETEINIVKSYHGYTVYITEQANELVKVVTPCPPRLG